MPGKSKKDKGPVSNTHKPSLTGREWPPGDGEMARRIREFDWAGSPVGPMESWSPALRMVVTLMLANRFPMILWWGPQYVQFYNDPYIPIPGSKHPDRALGQPASECWAEIWNVIGPLIAAMAHACSAVFDFRDMRPYFRPISRLLRGAAAGHHRAQTGRGGAVK